MFSYLNLALGKWFSELNMHANAKHTLNMFAPMFRMMNPLFRNV